VAKCMSAALYITHLAFFPTWLGPSLSKDSFITRSAPDAGCEIQTGYLGCGGVGVGGLIVFVSPLWTPC